MSSHYHTTHTYIHTHVHARTHTCTCIYTCIRMRTHDVRTYIRTYTHMVIYQRIGWIVKEKSALIQTMHGYPVSQTPRHSVTQLIVLSTDFYHPKVTKIKKICQHIQEYRITAAAPYINTLYGKGFDIPSV